MSAEFIIRVLDSGDEVASNAGPAPSANAAASVAGNQTPSAPVDAVGAAASVEGNQAPSAPVDMVGTAASVVGNQATSAIGKAAGAATGSGAAAAGIASTVGPALTAALANPIGIAVAATVGAFAIAGEGVRRFAVAMENEAERLANVSGVLASATAQAEIKEELGQLDRDQFRASVMEDGLSDVTDLNSDIREILSTMWESAMVPILDVAVSALVPFLEFTKDSLMELLRIMKTIFQGFEVMAASLPAGIGKDVGDTLHKVVEFIHKSLERLEDEDDDLGDDPFFADLLDGLRPGPLGAKAPIFPVAGGAF